MKHWLPGLLKTVVPAARNAIACIAPAQFIHKPPSPLPDMRDSQVLHVKVALAIFAVLFDIQEVGTVGREHRRDVRGDHPEPVAIASGGTGVNPLLASYWRCEAYGGEVITRLARAPANRRSTTSRSRQSPQITRCLPTS